MRIVEVGTPHQSSRDGHEPGMIVMHGDAGETDEGTVSWIQDPDARVSYHVLVGRDGTCYRFVDENRRAWHAGRSDWPGMQVGNSVNHRSLGVALANAGPHGLDTGPEPYREVQYRVAAEVVAGMMERHAIPLELIRGHYEVSPGRKHDPWDHFDWRSFYGWLGMYLSGRVAGTPGSSEPRPTLRRGSRGPDVERLQRLLREHEPSVQPDGIYGARTEAAVRAYQRDQELAPDGVVGPRTWARLLEEDEDEP